MENLKIKTIGMNGLLINLKEFKADKREIVKQWISKENYNVFKSELQEYEDNENVDIWIHNNFYYAMDKQDIEVLTESLVNAGGFVEQGEDLRYKFWLDNKLLYCIDLDII